MRLSSLALALLAPAASLAAQDNLPYQKPPAAIEQLLDAPPTPLVALSPNRATLLIEQPATFPTIADVAQPRYRLAGLRFNPASNGPAVQTYFISLKLQSTTGGEPKSISGLPANLHAFSTIWSPDSKHAAFVHKSAAGLELYVIDTATAQAHRIGATRLNAILGRPCEWLPDSTALLCRTVPATRGPAPKISEVPTGPHISENLGTVSPAPTYEDMLKNPTTSASSSTTPPPSSPSCPSPAPPAPSPSRASSTPPPPRPTANTPSSKPSIAPSATPSPTRCSPARSR